MVTGVTYHPQDFLAESHMPETEDFDPLSASSPA